MEQLKILGKQIKQTRLSLNMTMDICAEKAGITRATLWAIEKGTSNCSITSFLQVLEVLHLGFSLNNASNISNRERATRTNTILDKKINNYLIMCIEEYAVYVNKSSKDTYAILKEKGIIEELKNDYEDLHGFSQIYLNEYIDSLLLKED